MITATQIITKPWDVDDHLKALGLNQQLLQETVEKGFHAKQSARPNHPPVTGGSNARNDMICHLRDELCPLGWKKCDQSLMGKTFNEESGIALLVGSGTLDTGRANGRPTTKSKRGKTAEAYISNNQQMELWPVNTVTHSVTQTTWVLLYCFDDKAELRAELSLPVAIGIDGHIDQWDTRLILESIPVNPVDKQVRKEHEASSEIEIEIRKVQ